jgi:hypothetical protein
MMTAQLLSNYLIIFCLKEEAGFFVCALKDLFWVAFFAQALQGFWFASGYVTFRLAKLYGE